MNRGANSDSIPNDVIPDILSRLPAKSIARFRCVSKLWESIICRQDFTELFHTRSSSNPRLLIGVEQEGGWSFFSLPQPKNHYENSSLVVAAADFHIKFSKDYSPRYHSYASGLIYFPNVGISKEDEGEVRGICNPSTGQYAILPPTTTSRNYFGGLLGFDPISKQFKVLVYDGRVEDEWVYQILTLGTENVRWREIICPFSYDPPREKPICINGVLYYISVGSYYSLIGCFDVRFEKFKFLYLSQDCFRNWSRKLINYKGKLGVTIMEDYHGGFPIKLRMWVLEDVEKEEWTRYAYTLMPENKVEDNDYVYVVGATASGEIVLAKQNAYKPFYVFYFSPERNTLLSVEIQGVGEEWFYNNVYYFVDHVEDLRFDVMKTTYAVTSRSPPKQSTSTSSRDNH